MAQYQPKKILHLLHYDTDTNTIVEPIDLNPNRGFEHQFEAEVRTSTDLSLLGTVVLSWNTFKNQIFMHMDYFGTENSGPDIQDIVIVQMPPGINVYNPTLQSVVLGDVALILNGDFRAGTISLFGFGFGIWPDKLLNGNGIPAASGLAFGNAHFMFFVE